MKPILIALSILMLATSSCVTSVQPLVSKNKMITDPRITGVWMQNGTEVTIEPFSTSGLSREWENLLNGKQLDTKKENAEAIKKLYVVSYKKEDRVYQLLFSLIRINGNLFGDLYPAEMLDKFDPEAGFGTDNDFLPGYTIARLAIKDRANLSIEFLDGELIKKQVLAGNMRLKHEYDPLFGTFMITASSEELQQFLGKYGNDARFFPSGNSINLKRKG
ncbi:MAG: hypothetical protein ACTHMC_16130 [Pseudobacter sp.]|uniref:hypothetical protein n=1 Tax=Pseudobacter sp. TaxID=2045420 RepID=UPI003F7E7566